MKKFNLLVLALIFSLFFTACGNSHTELVEDNLDFEQLIDDGYIENIDTLLENMNDKNIIILGEHHGVSENFDIVLDIINSIETKKLNLVVEYSPAYAFMLNNYLKTRDDDLLYKVFENSKGTFIHTKESIKLYQNIKKISDSNKDIEIIGIDQDFVIENIILALETLNDERFLSDIENINSAKDIDSLIKSLESFVNKTKDLDSDKKMNEDVIKIAQGVEALLKNPKGDKNRDFAMYELFKRFVDPKIKTLCLLGGSHVLNLNNPNSEHNFKDLVSKDEQFKDKLLIGLIFYFDSKYMNADGSIMDLNSMFSKDSLIIKKALEKDEQFVFFDMRKIPLTMNGENIYGLIDYSIVLKNGTATEVLK
ncbi:MAG: hypothetical protein Q4P29_02200 [Tissierellia bacterium]|nr:hypothetical protein [Tissierellia bacterium]